MPTSASPPARKGFDYDSLDAETTQFVQQQTGEIRVLMKRTAQSIIEVGQKLIEVKEKLGHGRFGDWLEAEFEWGEWTASKFMQVAIQFQFVKFTDLRIAPSALYVLAAPSTPKAARSEALARAEAGEPITYTAAKVIKQKYASASTKTKPKPEPELELEPEPELAELELKPEPASAPTSLKELEIVAIHRQAPAPVLEEASRSVNTRAAQTLPVPQSSQPIVAPDVPGIWWQLGGRHLLYCGEPNSPDFLARIPEEVQLLLAFPPTLDWQPTIRSWTRLIIKYFPKGKDSRLFEEALEANLLLCSDIGDTVVSCFLPSLEILSIINRLERRGIFVEPDSRRVNAVISDWKRAGMKAERLS